jgi:hypothetical protein
MPSIHGGPKEPVNCDTFHTLYRPNSEILRKDFRVLSKEEGESDGGSFRNSSQSLYSGCTAELGIMTYSAILAFSESVGLVFSTLMSGSTPAASPKN